MTLPKLKAPTFIITMPSTGIQHTFRPFTMAEEKLLMMALESADEQEMIKALKETITACAVNPPVQAERLASFDLDWCLLKLRERSVGEVMDLMVKHQNADRIEREDGKFMIVHRAPSGKICAHEQRVQMDIRKVELIKDPNHRAQITLSEDPMIGITMRYPSIALTDRLNVKDESKLIDVIFEFLMLCIDTIFDHESVWKADDMPPADLMAFLMQFDRQTMDKIFEQFFDTMPKVQYKMKYTCDECGEEEEVVLEGLRSFF